MFLAIPVEDRLRLQLQELQEIALETLRDHGITDVRPDDLRNAHITVRFLGDVASAPLIKALDRKALESETFQFCVSKIGVFDSPANARVLWAGVDQLESFRELRGEIDSLLQPFDFKEERNSYTPHLTLARFRGPQDIRGCFTELAQLTDVCAVESYTVEGVVLYSSRLSPHGATHTKRALLNLS